MIERDVDTPYQRIRESTAPAVGGAPSAVDRGAVEAAGQARLWKPRQPRTGSRRGGFAEAYPRRPSWR